MKEPIINTMFTGFESVCNELKILNNEGSTDNIEYTRGTLEIIASFISFDTSNSHAENVLCLCDYLGFSEDLKKQLY